MNFRARIAMDWFYENGMPAILKLNERREMSQKLNCGKFILDLNIAKIMGILNCTPDSFSDGNFFLNPDKAIRHALAMVEEGADIIDIGGESTRPGAPIVSIQEELDRVIPVIEILSREINIPISLDTSKAAVMKAGIAAGINMINDVKALQEEGALAVAASTNIPICLMHMRGNPHNMQEAPVYQDVVKEVGDFLAERIACCEAAGIQRNRLLIDPGFGFGKTVEHNLTLIKDLDKFSALNLPIVLGVSRKSTIGHVLDRSVNERLAGSLALTVLAVCRGASMIRAHDVRATKDVVRMVAAVN